MKKLSFKKLSRPVRTGCWLLLFLVALFLIYAAFEFPLLGARMAFRQAEKDHMVGPSEIIDSFRQQGAASRQVTVAETEDLYLIHSYQTPYCHELRIYEKSDSPSIHWIPEGRYGSSFIYGGFDQLGLVLFDHCPEAAQVSVTFAYMYEEKMQSLTIGTQRTYDKFFVLTDFGANSNALDVLSDHFKGNGRVPVTVTVQFYDAQGALIRTEQLN
ncbi:MAG: hypothetical protein J6K03_00105 [Oscillospiraceae bacterium]|nr:hypothetical protein [Oscillospiraceae bacterium]